MYTTTKDKGCDDIKRCECIRCGKIFQCRESVAISENMLCVSCGGRELLELAIDADKISREKAAWIMEALFTDCCVQSN